MAKALEVPHSDSMVEVAGFMASPDIMSPEMIVMEEQPEFVIYTETVSDVQNQTDPPETVESEIVILEDQSVFICQDEALSDLDCSYVSESGNSGIIILENQSEILIYQQETLLAVQDQIDTPESEISGIIIMEEQPENYIYYAEPVSDPQGQMDSSKPTTPQIIIVEEHSEVSISQDESPSDVPVQIDPSGEAPFQLMHQGIAPISPTDHNRHFLAEIDTDHAPTLQDSENKNSDPRETFFLNLNHKFASLIKSRRRRFNKLPSTARRKLTYDP